MKRIITTATAALSILLMFSFTLISTDSLAQSRLSDESLNTASTFKSATQGKPGINTFTLAPNPAKDVIYATFWSGEPTQFSVTIYSMIGTALRSKSGICTIGVNNALIDLTGFAPGVYLIQINNHGVNYTGKILVQ